jgi:HrpA-like RNA helicase
MCEYLKVFDDKGKSVLPILITQPRKLATRTVAERVASEM